MSPHDVLKEHDITPTIDAERAYRLVCEKGYALGLGDARGDQSELQSRLRYIAKLEQVLTEIALLAERVKR